MSNDEGKSWKKSEDIPQGQAAMFIEHPFDNRMVSIINPALFVTSQPVVSTLEPGPRLRSSLYTQEILPLAFHFMVPYDLRYHNTFVTLNVCEFRTGFPFRLNSSTYASERGADTSSGAGFCALPRNDTLSDRGSWANVALIRDALVTI